MANIGLQVLTYKTSLLVLVIATLIFLGFRLLLGKHHHCFLTIYRPFNQLINGANAACDAFHPVQDLLNICNVRMIQPTITCMIFYGDFIIYSEGLCEKSKG